MRPEELVLNKLITLFLFIAVYTVGNISHISAENSIVTGDYQIKIITEPEHLIADNTVSIILKVFYTAGYKPVLTGNLSVDIKFSQNTLSEEQINIEDQIEGNRILQIFSGVLEADQFGNYEIQTFFDQPGNYNLKAEIRKLDGKELNPPIYADFNINVNPAPNLGFRLILFTSLLVLISIFSICFIYVRKEKSPIPYKGFNLLTIRWIRKFFLLKYGQTLFQVPLVISLIILIIISFIDIQEGGKNLSTVLVWTLWWTGVIFTFVMVGRLWCYMCPVGALAEWMTKIFRPERQFPNYLRNLWGANIIFILFTWFDVQVGVVRNPAVTGFILTAITLIALVTGMIFQRRTFCRYLCPIGGLIGIYSRFSAVELRSENPETCIKHKRKDCYLGNKKACGCPMFETIPEMDSNNLCNFCGNCIKSCPKNNIIIRTRLFFKDAWTTGRHLFDEAFLIVVLVGISMFVTAEMTEPWTEWINTAINSWPIRILNIEYTYTKEVVTKSVLFFLLSLIIIPGIILLSAAVSRHLAGKKTQSSLLKTFSTFAYMFIPIGLSMHLVHNVGHLITEWGEIIPAVKRTINKFTPLNIGEPDWTTASEPLMNLSTMFPIQMTLFFIFYIYSLYAGYRLSLTMYNDKVSSLKALIPMIVISFGLMLVNIYLINLPMTPRHIH